MSDITSGISPYALVAIAVALTIVAQFVLLAPRRSTTGRVIVATEGFDSPYEGPLEGETASAPSTAPPAYEAPLAWATEDRPVEVPTTNGKVEHAPAWSDEDRETPPASNGHIHSEFPGPLSIATLDPLDAPKPVPEVPVSAPVGEKVDRPEGGSFADEDRFQEDGGEFTNGIGGQAEDVDEILVVDDEELTNLGLGLSRAERAALEAKWAGAPADEVSETPQPVMASPVRENVSATKRAAEHRASAWACELVGTEDVIAVNVRRRLLQFYASHPDDRTRRLLERIRIEDPDLAMDAEVALRAIPV